MPIDGVVQEQIIDKASASEIKRGAIQRGLRTLRMDGVDKLLLGQTTPEEILRVTQLDIA
jgi:type II secretory ATPase GspE/PulE/Tfp pilus assembly ATPase PilB-like protein